MRNEIKELAGGNEWRIFTSRFYADYLSLGASDHDYSIVCDLVEKILKNLFNLDYTASNIIKNETIECCRNIRSQYRRDQYCMHVEVETDLFFVDFIFELTKIDEYFVLNKCTFTIDDEYLLSKLPFGSNAMVASCVSNFLLNQKYYSTTVNYRQLIQHFDGTTLVEDDCPTLRYEFNIKPNSIDLNFKYSYSDNRFSEGHSREPHKYFSMRHLDINSNMLLKIAQFHKLIDFYSSRIDLTDEFPQMTKRILISAVDTKCFLNGFLDSMVDVSDKVLVFEMASV